MKRMHRSKSRPTTSDELLPEYRLDYRKARPNRFAGRRAKDHLIVLLDPDVAQVFTTPESVNNVLRALINAMPRTTKRKTARSRISGRK